MAGTFTVQLPAGTDVTRLVNVPTAGSWLGGVIVSIATHSTDAQIHEMIFINDQYVPGNGDVKGYRHVGDVRQGANNRGYDDWILYGDTMIWFPLYETETMVKLHYTSAQEISLNVETTRTQWVSHKYPDYQVPPPTLYVYDGRIEWKPRP